MDTNDNSTGLLSIVSTPIGNKSDITIRALVILFNCDTVLCEDTRVTGNLIRLLKPYYISLLRDNLIEGREIALDTKLHLKPLYEHNEDRQTDSIINALKNGLKLCLVSDSGTPLISDPGYKLIRECTRQGLKIEVVPGPSSVLAGLVLSGLPPDKFTFVGYPPHKQGNRLKIFDNLKKQNEILKTTIIFFEAPHKLVNTLIDLKEIFGNIEITYCREMTKVYEETRSAAIDELLEGFKTRKPKGEYVVLVST